MNCRKITPLAVLLVSSGINFTPFFVIVLTTLGSGRTGSRTSCCLGQTQKNCNLKIIHCSIKHPSPAHFRCLLVYAVPPVIHHLTLPNTPSPLPPMNNRVKEVLDCMRHNRLSVCTFLEAFFAGESNSIKISCGMFYKDGEMSRVFQAILENSQYALRYRQTAQ